MTQVVVEDGECLWSCELAVEVKENENIAANDLSERMKFVVADLTLLSIANWHEIAIATNINC
jgi:hypothetical protein